MIYDISVPLVDRGVVYPGNPPIGITPHNQVVKGDSSNLTLLSFGSHSGTHVDAPKHFFDDGLAVDALSLDVLMGPCVLICVDDDVSAIGADHLRRHELAGHHRVLI